MVKPLYILKKHWGYDSFRPGQEAVINSILDGRDTLSLMPTGGGKSITFQVPAMAMPGICLVISPLLALMKDQVANLKKRGIMATYISSEMTRSDILQQMENCILGNYKFLYIAPERISSDLFDRKMDALSEKVNLIVVDEAHCISQWGHDFRRDYQLIADLRDKVKKVPFLAVTASATPAVVKDIIDRLNFREGYEIFQSEFVRKNLSYVMRHSKDKFKELCHILSSVKGSAIVYCRTRDGVEQYARELKKAGFSASYFHAGLDPLVKNDRQMAWQKGDIRILVATNAFGMGIDKGDVRLVLHTDFPDSIEAYYQESGRAGRDGLKAYAVALIGEKEIANIKQRPEKAFPQKDYIKKVYNSICNYFQIAEGDGEGCAYFLDEKEVVKNWHLNVSEFRASLHILDLSGYIKYEPHPNTQPFLRYGFTRESLDNFLDSESPAAKVAEACLRSFTGIFSDGCFFSYEELSRKTGYEKEQLIKLLGYLRNVGFVFVPARNDPRITFRQMRIPVERLHFPYEAYDLRKETLTKKIDSVVDFLETSTCRQTFISRYFGQVSMACGCCDNCIKARKAMQSKGR